MFGKVQAVLVSRMNNRQIVRKQANCPKDQWPTAFSGTEMYQDHPEPSPLPNTLSKVAESLRKAFPLRFATRVTVSKKICSQPAFSRASRCKWRVFGHALRRGRIG